MGEENIFLKEKTGTNRGLDTMQFHISSARVNAIATVLHLMICPIKLSTGGGNNVAGKIFMITIA